MEKAPHCPRYIVLDIQEELTYFRDLVRANRIYSDIDELVLFAGIVDSVTDHHRLAEALEMFSEEYVEALRVRLPHGQLPINLLISTINQVGWAIANRIFQIGGYVNGQFPYTYYHCQPEGALILEFFEHDTFFPRADEPRRPADLSRLSAFLPPWTKR